MFHINVRLYNTFKKEGIKMKELWKENKVLCVSTVIAVLIIFSYNASYNLPELIAGINVWYKLLNDLSIGVIINFLFYIFQIYIPTCAKRKKAYKIASPNLEWLYFLMSDIILFAEKFIKISNDNTMEMPNGKRYLLRHDLGSSKGWLITMEFSKLGIERYNNQINHTLEKITSNFMYSNNSNELIESLSMLQNNPFMKYLISAAEKKYSNAIYGDLQNSYAEFKKITTYLGKQVNKTCLEINEVPKEMALTWENQYNLMEDKVKDSIPRQCQNII